MGLFGKILKTGIDTLTTPVAIVKDVVTMGGSLSDESEPYTVKKLKQIGSDLEDVYDDLTEL